jgi:hypothetical protein
LSVSELLGRGSRIRLIRGRAATTTELRSHNNAGIPETIHRRALRQLHNFESDIYDPADAPLRYPRGRNGR